MLRRVTTSLILIFLLLLGGGYLYYKSASFDRTNKFNGIIYDKKAKDFTLINQSGEKITLSDFRGKIVLIDFGYTHCPDICPVILLKLGEVMSYTSSLYMIDQRGNLLLIYSNDRLAPKLILQDVRRLLKAHENSA